MTQNNRETLTQLLERHRELGMSEQIDFQKFYLYSILRTTEDFHRGKAEKTTQKNIRKTTPKTTQKIIEALSKAPLIYI